MIFLFLPLVAVLALCAIEKALPVTGPELDALDRDQLFDELTGRGMPATLAGWYVEHRSDPEVHERALFFIHHSDPKGTK